MTSSSRTQSDSSFDVPTRRSLKKERKTPHPTATRLLDTAVELLDEVTVEELTIALVLERSGVSYGSLYYHFEDIADLVEQAIVVRYERGLKGSLVAVRELLDSRDASDFRRRAEQIFAAITTPERSANRLDRIEAIGATKSRPRLVARIAHAQKCVTDEHSELLREFQRRGWMRSDIDPTVLSIFAQAIVLGRVVDDISEDSIDPELWDRTVMQVINSLYFPS